MQTAVSPLKDFIDRNGFAANNLPYNHDYVSAVCSIDEFQRAKGIAGGVAEIGVAAGAFFVPLALCCREGEVAVAIDVFDNLEDNWNVSGGTSALEALRTTLRNTLPPRTAVEFVIGDSFFIRPEDVLGRNGVSKVRFFSVDGSHSVAHTISDLHLAESLVVPGAVVFLDDIQNWGWPGVINGFARYMLMNDVNRLVPFFLFGNKLLLTTPSHHKMYLDFAVAVAHQLGRTQPDVDYRISDFFGFQTLGF